MDNMMTLSCPSCGAKLNVKPNASILKCEHCGGEHIVRHEDGAIKLEAFARCPKCQRNDKVEKVTAILRREPKNSSLTLGLSPPLNPNVESSPDYLHKPKLPPEPIYFPKPTLPEQPVYIYRKFKTTYFIVAAVLIIIAACCVGTGFTPTDGSIEISGVITSLFTALFPLAGGIFLLIKGLRQKQALQDLSQDFKASIKKSAKVKGKFGIIVGLGIAFLLISILISLLIFSISTEDESLALDFAFSIIPMIISSFFFIMAFSLKKKSFVNVTNLEKFEIDTVAWKKLSKEKLDSWEKENRKLENNWKEEINEILQDWNDQKSKVEARWETMSELWNELYFCYRDDILFIPGEGDYSVVEEMQNYLQKHINT